MRTSDRSNNTIAFAASGGLDSCTICHWLSSQGTNLICMTADLGQPDEDAFSDIEARMRASGATQFVGMPLKDEMAEIGIEVVQSQARYEGAYWNVTGAAREVIIQGMLSRIAHYGAQILSHGATGRGNDQVRFQVIAALQNPDLQFYAPWRDSEFLQRFGGRRAMLDYCQKHKIPIKASVDKPYSTDANLLGLTHEGGALEDLETSPYVVTPGMGVWPKDAPKSPERLSLRFERGRPIAVNGTEMTPREIFTTLNRVGGKHGVGIASHLVENRYVGVKSRGVYEAPAMEILGTAYDYILQLILDRHARSLFEHISRYLSVALYQGYWNDFSSRAARGVVAEIAARATATVDVELAHGNVMYIASRDAPHSLYTDAGSMEDEGAFDHRDSEGLLNILTLSARTKARAGPEIH